jgi:hypothetical protein
MQHSTMALIDAARAEGCLSANQIEAAGIPLSATFSAHIHTGPGEFQRHRPRPGRHCPSGQQLLTRMGDRP